MLDRVFVTRNDLPSLELSVQWHYPLLIFDHALLILRIQHSLIGTGYAGACRPDRDAFPSSRCRVNLQKWRDHLSTWNRLVHEELRAMSEVRHDNPPDPFETLKQGELLASSVAQAIAPKYIRKPGEVRRAFGFAGNRLLFRALNLLRKARAMRMWGVSGKVVLGAIIVVPAEQQLEMLEALKGLPEAETLALPETIVHLSGNTQGLTVWFSGPRQAGDTPYLRVKLRV